MEQSSGIGVLDKAVAVLWASTSRPLNLAELVKQTGFARATAHRLAVALEAHRLLARDERGNWFPGPALAELAAAAPDPLVLAADPILVQLRDETGESAQLYRREGIHRICIAAAERTSGLRDTVPVGAKLPMTAGSGAHVLTAWASPAETTAVLNEATFTERVLAEVRRRGWASSIGEREPGVASVSAPVWDHKNAVIAAISVSGPYERLGRRPGTRFGPLVVAAADNVSRTLAER